MPYSVYFSNFWSSCEFAQPWFYCACISLSDHFIKCALFFCWRLFLFLYSWVVSVFLDGWSGLSFYPYAFMRVLNVETTHFCCYNTYFILIKRLLKDNSSGPDACFAEYVAFHNVPIATGHVSWFTYNDFGLNFLYVMSLWYTFPPYFNSSDFLLCASNKFKSCRLTVIATALLGFCFFII